MTLKTLLRLMDPRTLIASMIPVLYGTVFSWHYFSKIHVGYTLLMLLALVLIQSSANMINDLADFGRDADDESKGTEKALVNGEITVRGVKRLVYIFVGSALLIGFLFAYLITWKLLIPVLLGLFVIIVYSSGPRPICYTAWGEATAGFTMGMLATTTIIFIQSGQVTFASVLATVPTTCFISMLLLSNNLGDWMEDELAGRKTLPIRFGVAFAEKVWITLLVVMYGSLLLFAVFNMISIVAAAIGIGLFPFSTIHTFFRIEKQNQNKPQLMKLAGMSGLRFHGIFVLLLISSHFFK